MKMPEKGTLVINAEITRNITIVPFSLQLRAISDKFPPFTKTNSAMMQECNFYCSSMVLLRVS